MRTVNKRFAGSQTTDLPAQCFGIRCTTIENWKTMVGGGTTDWRWFGKLRREINVILEFSFHLERQQTPAYGQIARHRVQCRFTSEQSSSMPNGSDVNE